MQRITWKRRRGGYEVKAFVTAIRSLQAWEEVLQELEYLKDRTTSPTMLLAYSEAIDIINQHLAEIEE